MTRSWLCLVIIRISTFFIADGGYGRVWYGVRGDPFSLRTGLHEGEPAIHNIIICENTAAL